MTAGSEVSSSMLRDAVRFFGKRLNDLMMNSQVVGKKESLKG